jgi:hypothetical protein
MSPDTVGLDFAVHDHNHELIRVQVKTTGKPITVGDAYRYDLDVVTYDRLRQGSTLGYLALVVVSAPHPRWTGHTRRGSVVRAVVHWVCLKGLPATDNAGTVGIAVPIVNVLTPETLPELFERA